MTIWKMVMAGFTPCVDNEVNITFSIDCFLSCCFVAVVGINFVILNKFRTQVKHSLGP